jgi:LysR family hydrogen peroxide-inducible transcriptional activator
VVTQALYKESFVVVLPGNHPLAARESISPKQLEKEPILLLGEGHCFRDQVLEACPGLRRKPGRSLEQLQSIVEGSSLETLKYMVASGMGITILPESAAQTGRYNNDLLTTRPLAGNAERTIALAWRNSFPRHQAIDALTSAIDQSRPGASPTV